VHVSMPRLGSMMGQFAFLADGMTCNAKCSKHAQVWMNKVTGPHLQTQPLFLSSKLSTLFNRLVLQSGNAVTNTVS
jgi:hypothetical protein